MLDKQAAMLDKQALMIEEQSVEIQQLKDEKDREVTVSLTLMLCWVVRYFLHIPIITVKCERRLG